MRICRIQGFANEVFGAAYNITTDADSALGIFDDLVVILNVDVNVSGMNSDVAVSLQCIHGHCVHQLYPKGIVYLPSFIVPLAGACPEKPLMRREWKQTWSTLGFDTYLPSQMAHQVSK